MKPFSIIAATIFLLMALAHLYRIAVGFPIMIGATGIGQAVSWAGLIVASVMAVGLFREGLRGRSHRIKLTAQFDPAKPNTQIHSMRIGPGQSRAEFWDRNDNEGEMDVSYQWEFTCPDGTTVQPFDPIIANGGKM